MQHPDVQLHPGVFLYTRSSRKGLAWIPAKWLRPVQYEQKAWRPDFIGAYTII